MDQLAGALADDCRSDEPAAADSAQEQPRRRDERDVPIASASDPCAVDAGHGKRRDDCVARLVLRRSDARDLRIGEHDLGYHGLAKSGSAPGRIQPCDRSFAGRDVRVEPPSGDVAGGVDVLDLSPTAVVDRHESVAQRQSGPLAREPVDVRAPPGRDEQRVALDGTQSPLKHDVAGRRGRALDRRTGEDGDAVAPERGLDGRGHRVPPTRENVRQALDQRDLSAGAPKRLPELDARRAPAEHQQPLREFVELEHRLVREIRDLTDALDRAAIAENDGAGARSTSPVSAACAAS